MKKPNLRCLMAICCFLLLAGNVFALDETVEPVNNGFLKSVFTKMAPKFGGDANIEYDTRDSNYGDSLTSRVRLTMDADISPRLYLHTRLTAKQYIDGNENGDHPAQAAGYENEAVKVGMEQFYLGFKFSLDDQIFNNMELILGRQPLWLAGGMLSDINGINGIKLKTSFLGINAFGFFGKDGTQALEEDRGGSDGNLGAAELSRAFGPVTLGVTYLNVNDDANVNDATFYEGNVSYQTPFGALLYAQYLVNDDADEDDTGYRVKAIYGNAVKQGEWDASFAYLRIESSINPNDKYYINDGNWIGAKGVRVKIHYAVTDWSTLILVQDVFENINTGEDQNRTDIEFEVRF